MWSSAVTPLAGRGNLGNGRNEIGRRREKAGTLVPGAAIAVWELTLKFPKFPHINFRTGAPSQSGQLPVRGQHEAEVVSLGSVSRLALFHGKYVRGMS